MKFHVARHIHLPKLVSDQKFQNFLDFKILKFLVTHQLGKANMPCHVKFHQNWSNVSKDIVKVCIFHTFGMKTLICTLFAVWGIE